MRRRAIAASLVLLAACRDWRTRVDPARAAAEPIQVSVAGARPIELEVKRHQVRLTPRATYAITGYAAETSRELLDEWDFVIPMDVALVWGPVADPAVLSHLKFHLSGRYVSYWYDGEVPPRVVAQLNSHIANNHLVPADGDVAGALARIHVGDLVTLRGKLVDVEIRDPDGREVFRSRTSLTRDDVGSGACEQVYVESVEVERPE
ncbi:MAG TPA: hypothetical protein VLU43_12325 [Anaeromyxobacteraceae bacterium]|nr:hypothetical protein [Anaeromyxobacteraceae bacterium]